MCRSDYLMLVATVLGYAVISSGHKCVAPFIMKWEDEDVCYFKSSPSFTLDYLRAQEECERLGSTLVKVGDWWEGQHIFKNVMWSKNMKKDASFWVDADSYLPSSNPSSASRTDETRCPLVRTDSDEYNVSSVHCGEKHRFICRTGNYTAKTDRPKPVVEVVVEVDVKLDESGTSDADQAGAIMYTPIIIIGCLFVVLIIAAIIAVVLVKKKKERRSFDMMRKEFKDEHEGDQYKRKPLEISSPLDIDVSPTAEDETDLNVSRNPRTMSSFLNTAGTSPTCQTPSSSARSSEEALLPLRP